MTKTRKEKLVMIFGTFDYLHAGHENFINQAKELGTEVLAIIARDKTVKTIKGNFPDHTEKERLKNLLETKWIDNAILGNLKDKTKVIKSYFPDIIALGYDQFAFTYSLKKLIMDLRLNTEIIRLKPYRPDMYKSSIIKNKKKTFESKAKTTV